jgi:hypothetical protein
MNIETKQSYSPSFMHHSSTTYEKNNLLVKRNPAFHLETKKEKIKAFSPNQKGKFVQKPLFLEKYREFVFPSISIF